MSLAAQGHPASLVSLAHYLRETIDSIASLSRASFARSSRAELPGLAVTAFHSDDTLADPIENNFIPTRSGGGPVETLTAFIVHPKTPGVLAPSQWPDIPYHANDISQVIANFGLRASHYHDLDQWHIYDVQKRIAVQLMTGPAACPPWEAAAPLRPFLHWYYAEKGMRLAHTGTLGLNGKGILLPGTGGSGKSGTVMAGIKHGLQSVGDDYVLLSCEPQVRARPVYATLKQDPKGFQRLDLDKDISGPLTLNWQGKYEISLPAFSRQPIPSELQITAILVPQIANTTTTKITPVSRAEAMMALAASSIHQMQDERESGFRFFSNVTRQLPCYRIALGQNPAEVADCVAHFIEGLPE